jgi:serine/threonine-protein kinase
MMKPSPERWARIEGLVDELLDLPADRHAAHLDSHCSDDHELRAEVERLLASCMRAESMFESPPLLVAQELASLEEHAARDDVSAGHVVGTYRVVRLLGRGGMGAVFLAERDDGAFQRQVALKIVKRGMDTDEIVGRFRRERQILAQLEHPNIAGLLDGGVTDGGLPYFVMELAPGQSIDRYCDAARLDIDARLTLFMDVCHAVQHAHRNLVVHRDLKPGNILVSDEGVKLLDFGIAKVLQTEAEDEPATRLEERRLTPEYAAPEQILGKPTTTATDVYALGVILYELLAGRQPYVVSGTLAEIERTVCEVMPRAPSLAVQRNGDGRDAEAIATARGTRPDLLRDQLSGDLDAIVLRALQKEPDRRYPSVEAFAEDISRYLTGMPVVARPDTRWYRVSKFVQRNLLEVALAAAAVTILIAGLIATILFAREADAQAQIATAQAGRANRELDNRESALDWLEGIFGEIDPDRIDGLGRYDQTVATIDQLMERANVRLELLTDRPEVYAAAANMLGRILFRLGDTYRADSVFRSAHKVLSPLGDQPDLAVSMMGIGEVARRNGQFQDAERWFRDALRVRESVFGPDDPRIAEALAGLAFSIYNQHPGSPEKLAEADRLYAQAAAFGDAVPLETRVRISEGFGDIRLAQGNYVEAEAFYQRSLNERQPGEGLDPGTARMMWGLGDAVSKQGREEEGLRFQEAARDALLQAYGPLHPEVGLAYYRVGYGMHNVGRLHEAEEQLQNAVRAFASMNDPTFSYLAYAWDQIGQLQIDRSRFDAAVQPLDSALAIYEKHDPGANRDVAIRYYKALANRGIAVKNLGRDDARALADLRESYTKFAGPLDDPREAARTAAALADLYRRIGPPDSVAVYQRRAAATSPGGT